jgi:hypothetical protein
MKVDAVRRILWVCSSAESFMQGYSDADAGKAALFKYDLRTRKLISKDELGPKPAHLLNDVALNAQGDVFVTDTFSGEIYTVTTAKMHWKFSFPQERLLVRMESQFPTTAVSSSSPTFRGEFT